MPRSGTHRTGWSGTCRWLRCSGALAEGPRKPPRLRECYPAVSPCGQRDSRFCQARKLSVVTSRLLRMTSTPLDTSRTDVRDSTPRRSSTRSSPRVAPPTGGGPAAGAGGALGRPAPGHRPAPGRDLPDPAGRRAASALGPASSTRRRWRGTARRASRSTRWRSSPRLWASRTRRVWRWSRRRSSSATGSRGCGPWSRTAGSRRGRPGRSRRRPPSSPGRRSAFVDRHCRHRPSQPAAVAQAGRPRGPAAVRPRPGRRGRAGRPRTARRLARPPGVHRHHPGHRPAGHAGRARPGQHPSPTWRP